VANIRAHKKEGARLFRMESAPC